MYFSSQAPLLIVFYISMTFGVVLVIESGVWQSIAIAGEKYNRRFADDPRGLVVAKLLDGVRGYECSRAFAYVCMFGLCDSSLARYNRPIAC